MSAGALVTAFMGPFTGVVDTKGSSVALPGKLRSAKNLTFAGLNRLSVRQGSTVVLTLMDDAGTPAEVTKVLAVETFMDGAIALAHSTATNKVYLYRLPATMDGWYDAAGALQTSLTPAPIGTVWTAITSAPDVSVAEGLGTLYLACSSAITAAGVGFRTRQVTFSAAGVPTLADLAATGTGGAAGADFAYFTAIASFHQHLWGVGYGVGAVAGYTSYRPELARFSQPSFGALQTVDSIVIGDRVRAIRERALGLCVAGNALFLGASKALFRVTGYGRDSWIVESLDDKYGFAGPKAFVAVGGTLYYWTSRGLARCTDGGTPEPLWDAIPTTVATVANESKIVLGFDKDTDQVQAFFDAGDGVRTLCVFDTRRDTFVATAGDIGLAINCAGVVDPIYASTSSGPAAPGDPVIVGTDTFTATGARLLWTVGDALAQHELSVRQTDAVVFTVIQTTDAGIASFTASGLLPGVNYEWRIRALKNGMFGAYVGPSTDSQFATLGSSGTGIPSTAPTGLAAVVVIDGKTRIALTWVNADPTLPVQLLRSSDGATFAQVGSVGAGVESTTNDPHAFGTFYYQVRHVASDGTAGTASDVASITTTPP